jgi:hypothetical protein
MVQPKVNMLCSAISHMPLLYVWQKSGVTQRQGFDLNVDVTGIKIPGQRQIGYEERATSLLDGTYDILSGLHHEPYFYRARGEKRFVYLAQAQNDWDDRLVGTQEIKQPSDLNGKKIILTSTAPCVMGNLKHSLELGGADLSSIEWILLNGRGEGGSLTHAVERVAKGEADAVSVDTPFDYQGVKMGLHKIDVPTVPVIHNATICSNRDWVQANEETATAFLRSMVDAVHFFKTEKQKTCEILTETIAQLMGLKEDEVEEMWKTWAGLLSPKPFPHPLAVWNVYNLDVAHSPEANWIGPFEIWDTSLLRAIDDSGYIDELYGSAQLAQNPAVNVAI